MARAVAVAYSGGRDSTALLHATLEAAAPLGVQVVAFHIHHGMNDGADAWLSHCEATCRHWALAGRPIAFEARHLDGRPAPGDSVEAWARRARYGALREMAQEHGIDLVLLGHHRRDQAETFLLQALRGAGVDGLSAMPGLIVREGITWARPWLESPREAIEAYVRTHRLSHIEDVSNDDPRFDRNRMRASVWPSLLHAFPGAEASLADAARRAQDGAAGLAEWSRVDLAAVGEGEALDVERWRSLPPVRRSNVLRVWLRQRCGRAPPATLSERLLDELGRSASGRWPAPPGELRLHRGRLRYEASPVDELPAPGASSSIAIDLHRVGEHRVDAWCGTFVVRRVDSGGVAARVARSLELRARRAGDRFQASAGRPPRGLKLQFQAAGVPAWQRIGPIATSADEVVYVPGLGLDAGAVAITGSPRVAIDWRPDRPAAVGAKDPGVRR